MRADISDPADRQALIDRLRTDHGDATLLINAAGVFLPKSFFDHTEADYDLYHHINRAMFFITQAVARGMVARGKGGAIVTIGSMWAKQAVQATPSSAYSMAKAGLHALTQHLAMELAGAGIRVNAVSPAVVETPIYEGFIAKEQVHDTLASTAFTPLVGSACLRTWPRSSPSSYPTGRPGSPARSGTSTAASWPDGTITADASSESTSTPAPPRHHARAGAATSPIACNSTHAGGSTLPSTDRSRASARLASPTSCTAAP